MPRHFITTTWDDGFDALIFAEIARLEDTKPNAAMDAVAWTGAWNGRVSLSPASDKRRVISQRQLRVLSAHSAYPVIKAIADGIADRRRVAREAAFPAQLDAVHEKHLSIFTAALTAITDLIRVTQGPDALHYSDFRFGLQRTQDALLSCGNRCHERWRAAEFPDREIEAAKEDGRVAA